MISNKKVILDILLMLLLIPLMYFRFTGGLIHELLGIAFTIVVFIHLVFNYKWIKSVTKNYKNVKPKIKLLYIINIIVFISYFIAIITGILISRYIFLFISSSFSLTSTLHNISSYISLILTFVHLLLHYKDIKNTIENKVKSNSSKGIAFTVLAIITTIFAIVIYDKKDLIKVNKKEVLNNTKVDSNSNQIKKDTSEPIDNPPTLVEYLSKLHCSGCGNRCVLTSLKCPRGQVYREMAEADYNEKYNITE